MAEIAQHLGVASSTVSRAWPVLEYVFPLPETAGNSNLITYAHLHR